MMLPPVVAGLALLMTWGRNGMIGHSLSIMGIEIGFTTLAVIMAQSFVAMPFLVTSLEGAIRSRGYAYERAAAALGASKTRIFFQVSLPMMLPALVSGIAMSFSRALGEFGATITFAGSLQGVTRTMPLAIYLQRESKTEEALALAVVLIVLAILVMLAANALAARLPGGNLEKANDQANHFREPSAEEPSPASLARRPKEEPGTRARPADQRGRQCGRAGRSPESAAPGGQSHRSYGAKRRGQINPPRSDCGHDRT